MNNFDVNGSAVIYTGNHAVQGSTVLNKFGTVSTNNDDTPSVLGKNNLLLEYAGGHTITNFDDGIDGQEITVTLEASSAVTIEDNAYILTPTGGNLSLQVGDVIKFINVNGVWRCSGYSDNT